MIYKFMCKKRYTKCFIFVVGVMSIATVVLWERGELIDIDNVRVRTSTVPLEPRLLRLRARSAHGALRNAARFGPLTPDTPALVVLARGGARALRRLLAALAAVRHIDTALLVLSHAVYDETINDLVRDIRFCRVVQVFYPHSVLNRSGSIAARPAAAAHKHHWWWTAHYVFERLAGAAPALFLEEHDTVAPDALHMARHAQRALAYFPAARLLALGGAPGGGALSADLLTLDAWRPAYGTGTAFNRSTWRRIAELAVHYCMYDDSGWSHSLLNVFAQFPGGRADVVACGAARVRDARAGVGGWPRPLFPQRVRLRAVWARGGRAAGAAAAPAGGGGDLRDRLHCLDPELDFTAELDVDADDDDATL